MPSPFHGRGLLLLAWGCASEPPPEPPPERPPEVLVPQARVSLHTESMPLQVELPASALGAVPTVRLDGVEVEASAFIRPWGARALLIGELNVADTPVGPHRLEVRAGTSSASRPFMLSRPSCPMTLLVQEDGQPTAARVVVWKADGPESAPVSLLDTVSPKQDRSKREAALDSVFLPGGSGRLWLAPGRYTLAATQGLRAGVALQDIDPCGTPTVTMSLGPGLSTARIAADLHIHTGHSPDAWLPDPRRIRSLATSGLDVAVITDHNTLDWERSADASPTQVLGLEHTHAPDGLPLAHLNAFPLALTTPLPDSDGRSLAGTIDDLRALPGVRYVQLDHPRGVDLRLLPNDQPVKPPPYEDGTTLLIRSMSYAIWSHPGIDRNSPLSTGHNAWLQQPEASTSTTSLSLDAVEVLNRSSVSRWLEVRADWFYLLNRGVWITGTGNSDSHDASVELAGMPSNLLLPVGGETDGSLADSLLSGNVVVSTGPVPEILVREAGSDGPWTAPGGIVTGGKLEVRAVLKAAPWVPVDELRLIVDGKLFDRRPIAKGGDPTGEPLVYEAQWTVSLADDGWLLLEAGWPLDGTPADVAALPLAWRMAARGYVPIGFTNPVRVDADGDGKWAPQP